MKRGEKGRCLRFTDGRRIRGIGLAREGALNTRYVQRIFRVIGFPCNFDGKFERDEEKKLFHGCVNILDCP